MQYISFSAYPTQVPGKKKQKKRNNNVINDLIIKIISHHKKETKKSINYIIQQQKVLVTQYNNHNMYILYHILSKSLFQQKLKQPYFKSFKCVPTKNTYLLTNQQYKSKTYFEKYRLYTNISKHPHFFQNNKKYKFLGNSNEVFPIFGQISKTILRSNFIEPHLTISKKYAINLSLWQIMQTLNLIVTKHYSSIK
eukprot:TRINITY_DN8621_c0_g1_i2.p2 TRINITY_DN8621_c0_g1~~TRINITY_DN8621_c0_g1_i2.p2  ORF type:complete len:195 (+),score=-16.92 TRINITY_DN8621_c0_g1_i2:808-1392(+)